MKLREYLNWRWGDEVQHKETADNSALLTPWGPNMPEPTRVEILRDRFPNSGNMGNLKLLAHHIMACADGFQSVEEGDPEDHPAGRVMLAMGGHVIKSGCGPIVADLANRGFISALLVSGAWLIHDVEMALFGATSEYVDDTIAGGRYGFTKETIGAYGSAVMEAAETGRCLFNCLGDQIRARVGDAGDERSVIAHLTGSLALGVPVPVFSAHALGTDTVHNHPSLDWGLLGRIAQHEFDMLLDYFVDEMRDGVWINAGSAVLLPEIFLKTLSAAANVSNNPESDARFPYLNLTAVMDFQQPYRAVTSVLNRARQCGATHGLMIQGPHEFTFPLLRECVMALFRERECLWRDSSE